MLLRFYYSHAANQLICLQVIELTVFSVNGTGYFDHPYKESYVVQETK